MDHRFDFRRRRFAAAAASACAAFAFLPASGAHARTLAACGFQTHVTVSGGSFSSDGAGNTDCTGFVDGSLTGGNGGFEAQGMFSGTPCSVGSWAGTFDAEVPRALTLFDAEFMQLLGNLHITEIGHSLLVSGSGTVDGQPVAFAGTGTFAPDGDQSCSGTLTENVAIMDGGNATAGPSPDSVHHRKRHHHRRHNRRHR